MNYTLPDGRAVQLEKIARISQVRDLGDDSSTIGSSKLAFYIHISGQTTLEVSEYYHFSDWVGAKFKLRRLREDLFTRWKTAGYAGTD